jgi:hypothetical protein
VTLFLAALLAIVFAPGTDDEVVQRAHVRVAGERLVGASCHDLISGAPELGVATIGFEFRLIGGRRIAAGRYTGKLTFALKREERSYDESTSHGRRQHLAPGDLAGPDTIIRCS